jgi:hypothetical protein
MYQRNTLRPEAIRNSLSRVYGQRLALHGNPQGEVTLMRPAVRSTEFVR